MALAANAVADMQGGWAPVRAGAVPARRRYELAGLMPAVPAEEMVRQMRALSHAAEGIGRRYEPSTLAGGQASRNCWPGPR